VQTRKIRSIPVILVQRAYWQGLVEWIGDRMVSEGMIDPEDVSLMQLIDEPEGVVEAIFNHYEKRGFTLTAAEREAQLNL
jgi:predicted Rossmann-fold nucleotide-binding protein